MAPLRDEGMVETMYRRVEQEEHLHRDDERRAPFV